MLRLSFPVRSVEICRDDRDRSKFLGYLAEGAERYRVKVHCSVLRVNRQAVLDSFAFFAWLIRLPIAIGRLQTVQ
jgi:hypothetical protein